MERIERVVVQLLEARRLTDERTQPHGRLALLLLDNLAEILLYREADHQLAMLAIFRPTLERLNQASSVDAEAARLSARLSERTVSRRREQKIRQYFGAKLDFLVQKEALDAAHARMLRKLHKYRNEAYHRDMIRQDALQSAVDIYLYLACELMRVLPVHSYSHSSHQPSKYLAPYIEELGTLDGFRIQSRVAEQLQHEKQFDSAGINAFLRKHLLARIEDIHETLEFWVSGLPNIRDAAQLLHHCQIPEDAIQSPADLLTLDELRVDHDFSSLEAWKEQAASIREDMSVVEAFVTFADIEDEFEELEAQVIRFAEEMDRAIQEEADIRRGK